MHHGGALHIQATVPGLLRNGPVPENINDSWETLQRGLAGRAQASRPKDVHDAGAREDKLAAGYPTCVPRGHPAHGVVLELQPKEAAETVPSAPARVFPPEDFHLAQQES